MHSRMTQMFDCKVCQVENTHSPPSLGRQHFFKVKLSSPDFSTKVFKLLVSSFMLENSWSQPSSLNMELFCVILNCLYIGFSPSCQNESQSEITFKGCSHIYFLLYCDVHLWNRSSKKKKCRVGTLAYEMIV